jgi:hypothetical protein
MDRPTAFFTLTLLALLVLLSVFAMKYVTAARASGGRAALDAMRSELTDVKTRLAALETLLKEVG